MLHSRPEQEVFYDDGVFAQHHPVAFVVQMGWDANGYNHPLYVGLVNKDRTRGCLVGSRNIAYGGPETVEEDVEGRTFVIQTHIPELCSEAELGSGPYDVWVGANRLISANPDIVATDVEAPDGQEYAFLKEGNVLVFGSDSITDMSGQGRGAACGEIVAGVGAFERTDAPCGAPITVVDSPGSNILIDKMDLSSSVAILLGVRRQRLEGGRH